MPTYEGKSAPAVQEFESLAGTEADPADLHLCPQGGAFATDQPSPAFNEHYLRGVSDTPGTGSLRRCARR